MIPFPLQRGGLGRAGAKVAKQALLMHCDGSNGSTTFTDSSPAARSMTRSGTVVAISTAQSVFGGASLSCVGAGVSDYLQAAAASSDFDFGAGDFTVEAWAYAPTGMTGVRVMLGNRDNGGGANDFGWIFIRNASNALGFACWDGSSVVASFSGGSFTTDTWHHVAATRQGHTFRLFLNGALAASATGTGVIGASTRPLSTYDYTTGGRQWTGYLDEMRVFKGFAAYTSAFTPPTNPFG